MNEKQIIVRLPAYVSEEDIINFYCTLKLMYTKKWDFELADNLAKGVGCLSVCCEIGFHEGIEACWKWLVRKCNRDKNSEMMKLLIETYPNLHEQFTHQVERDGYSSDSKLSRNTSKRRSRRNNWSKHLCQRTDSYDSDPSNN
ncbi:27953_t:CDS:1, partial [Racocetra persica]